MRTICTVECPATSCDTLSATSRPSGARAPYTAPKPPVPSSEPTTYPSTLVPAVIGSAVGIAPRKHGCAHPDCRCPGAGVNLPGMNYETLRYSTDGHVTTLVYDRPQQHNAISRKMNEELHHAWQRFRDDDDAFVLVITGAGETTFCAGWDLQDAADLAEVGDYDAFRVSLHNSPGECGYTRKVDIFKPVIAAVNGYAFAAGLETALLADIRIASENAEFGALERRWNIVGGDGMTVRLPLVVGFAKAMELIITGRRIDAREAERIGLVNEVVPEGGALARAQELAREIAALPQGAIRSDKESVMRGVGHTLEERLRIEAEQTLSMFMRRDPHTLGAAAFKAGNLSPDWPHHGL